MQYGTTSYTQETPKQLWHRFKTGPAEDYDRIHDRITELIALDVLATASEQLPDDEQAYYQDLVDDLPLDPELLESGGVETRTNGATPEDTGPSGSDPRGETPR